MPDDITCKRITIELSGRIDSSNVSLLAERIEAALDKTEEAEVMFDASGLEYISSAGLRELMKVRKRMGNTVSVIEVSAEVYEIFETTGFTELLSVRKRLRRISVDGCEIIGKGFYGTVYRLDEDTIIKVYASPDSLPMIENEKKMARLAFLKGIPTAISYDVVRVGDSYGAVFELLKAKTFNDLIIEQPDRIDELTDEYARFVRLIHETRVAPGELPSAKQTYLDHLDHIHEYIGDDRYERLKSILERTEEDTCIIHGDLQMKNVMKVDNEPMLIDMDNLSMGNPVFDLAGLYVTYRCFEEDEPGNSIDFLGIDAATEEHIWNRFMHDYFNTDDRDEIEGITDKIRLAASIRFLHIVTSSTLKDSETGRMRIRHTGEHIDELLERFASGSSGDLCIVLE